MEQLGFRGLIRFKDDQVDPDNHIRRCFFEVKQEPIGSCPYCGAKEEEKPYKHGVRSHKYRDLPILGDRVVLEVRVHRSRCRRSKEEGCGKIIVPQVEGFEPHWSMTSRCREWIRANCLVLTSQFIADHIGCDEKTVRTLMNDRIDELNLAYRPEMPEWLGVDETSPSGRIDESITVLVDVEKKKPIDLLEDRKGTSLKDRLVKLWKDGQPIGVTMDMCDAYRDVIGMAYPKAVIVADRFHIEQIANKAIDRVRIDWGRGGAKGETKSDVWKQNTRLLRMHQFNIPRAGDSEQQIKEKTKQVERKLRKYDATNDFFKWLDFYLKIKKAYFLKEHFCQIYLYHTERKTAERAFELWEACVPPELATPFKKLISNLAQDKWREEFLAYFGVGAKKTNGYTEGLNSVIKRINRLGNGYKAKVLRARVLFGDGKAPPFARIRPRKSKSVEAESELQSRICSGCARDLNDSSLPQPAHEGISLQSEAYCLVCRIPVESMLVGPCPDRCEQCRVLYDSTKKLKTFEPVRGHQYRLCECCYRECVYLKENLYDPSTLIAGGETSVSTSITGDPGFELFQDEKIAACLTASSSTSETNAKCDPNFTPAPRTTTCAKDIKEEFPDQTTEKHEQLPFAFLVSAS
jgi:transposase